ncbi:hypothetical protein chiPu_0009593 [Chiloscyllium punctatum]|uniref:Uncharacterized protein n=1 Tax=Chiloscyllium punctatum TaxID=137246 RepID=A0A401SL59_CHIPU|nr:hypothetical protein [Chiloscyllium punctatum]
MLRSSLGCLMYTSQLFQKVEVSILFTKHQRPFHHSSSAEKEDSFWIQSLTLLKEKAPLFTRFEEDIHYNKLSLQESL